MFTFQVYSIRELFRILHYSLFYGIISVYNNVAVKKVEKILLLITDTNMLQGQERNFLPAT